MTRRPPGEFRVLLFGPGHFATLRIAVAVIGFVVVACLVGFPIMFMTSSEEDRVVLVVGSVVAAMLFGVPLAGAVWLLQNPPQDTIVVHPAGISRVGGRLDWDLSWMQIRRIAVRVGERRLPGVSVARLQHRRTISLVFAPEDPERFRIPGGRRWTGRQGYTVEMRFADEPFKDEDPHPMAELDAALRACVPHLYDGILRDG